jgi:hypothetical protein
VCDDRVAKLYGSPRRDEYACRECQGLLYESQTYTQPMAKAFDRMRQSREQLREGVPTREALREYYESVQDTVEAFNGCMDDLDERFGEYGRETDRDRERINEDRLPSFEVWIDRQLSQMFGAGIRPYNRFGRCTATAKTTDERCRQPALGDHGKCYYHGGAPGSGLGEAKRQVETPQNTSQDVD